MIVVVDSVELGSLVAQLLYTLDRASMILRIVILTVAPRRQGCPLHISELHLCERVNCRPHCDNVPCLTYRFFAPPGSRTSFREREVPQFGVGQELTRRKTGDEQLPAGHWEWEWVRQYRILGQ